MSENRDGFFICRNTFKDIFNLPKGVFDNIAPYLFVEKDFEIYKKMYLFHVGKNEKN